MKIIPFVLALALVASLSARAEEREKEVVKPYPFDFCIVQEDEKLDPYAEPYSAVHEGQQYRFCCHDCWKEFRKNPEPFVKKFKTLLEKQKEMEKEKDKKDEKEGEKASDETDASGNE